MQLQTTINSAHGQCKIIVIHCLLHISW